MVRKFGGDPAATDSTRVLRLPGFLNRKYEAEFRVQAVRHADPVSSEAWMRLGCFGAPMSEPKKSRRGRALSGPGGS